MNKLDSHATQHSDAIAQLMQDVERHYDRLHGILVHMLQNDPEQLHQYPVHHLMRFPELLPHVMPRLRTLAETEQNLECKRYYLYNLLACGLVSGNIAAYNQVLENRDHIDTSLSALGLDFRPLTGLVIILDSSDITILADDQADIEKCRFFASGIEQTLHERFGGMQPKPTVFFLRGKGPSPYHVALHSAFLMVGHYKGSPGEREQVHAAILHELTHISIGTGRRVRIEPEMNGVFKFLDEGVAIQNSYTSVPQSAGIFTKFFNSAVVLHEFTPFALQDIMTNWFEFLYKRQYLPTYDYACTFVAFLDSLPGESYMEVFRQWGMQAETVDPLEYLCRRAGITWQEVEQRWLAHIGQFAASTTQSEATQIRLEQHTETESAFSFTSRHELWPEKDIFCIREEKELLPVHSDAGNSYRYCTAGGFYVECGDEPPAPGSLRFIVLHKGSMQSIVCPSLSPQGT